MRLYATKYVLISLWLEKKTNRNRELHRQFFCRQSPNETTNRVIHIYINQHPKIMIMRNQVWLSLIFEERTASVKFLCRSFDVCYFLSLSLSLSHTHVRVRVRKRKNSYIELKSDIIVYYFRSRPTIPIKKHVIYCLSLN
jgi:hypothetical protein